MKAYIFTSGVHWFVEWYKSLQEAEKNAPNGYTVDLYITTKQIP